jgi:hypothetical protein
MSKSYCAASSLKAGIIPGLGWVLPLIIAIQFAAYGVTAPVSLNVEAEHFSSKQGGVFDPPADKEPRLGVKSLANGNWVRFDSINFMNGEYDSIYISLWTGYPYNPAGASIQIRLDSPTGTVIATISTIPTTMPYGYAYSTVLPPAHLATTTGIHSIVLCLVGGSGPACDIDRFRLAGTLTTTPTDAQTYYVATDGDDNADGLDVSRPFKTIQKAATVMRPGSICNIRQGIYRETVKPAWQGIAGAPITFQAYNGENVVISGTDPVTGWTTYSGSIYKAPMNWTIGRYNDQVIVDGKMAWVARTPNVDENYNPSPYLTYCGGGVYSWKQYQNQVEPIVVPSEVCIGSGGSGSGGSVSFNFPINQDNSYPLPASLFNHPANFYNGGLVSIRNYWYGGVGEITGSSSSATSTTISGRGTNSMWSTTNGPGYISYVLGLLDEPNEWYHDGASNTLYLWAPDGGNPSNHLVEAKKRILGFDLRGKQYFNLFGLRMIATSMTLESANNCIVDSCHFKYVCHADEYNWFEAGCEGFWHNPFDPYTGYAGIFVSGSNNIIKNSSVIGSAMSGIILNGKHNTVSSCRVHSCDYIANYQAGIYFMQRDRVDPNDGMGNVVTHCSIKGCMRGDIQIGQAAPGTTPENRTLIEYNDLGMAAYGSNETGNIAGQSSLRVEVSHNWIHDVGFLQNCDVAMEYDNGARGWILHHNVCWKGTPLLPGIPQGPHFFIDFLDIGATGSIVYNNTWVNSCDVSRGDVDTAWPNYMADGGLGHGALNMLYARDDTAKWMFANAKNNDYSLRAGSPAVNSGKVLPGLTAETTVPDGKPDLGAYEFGQPVWTAGASWPEQPWAYPPSPVATANRFGLIALSNGGRFAARLMPDRLIIQAPGDIAWQANLYDSRGALVSTHTQLTGGTAALSTQPIPMGMYVLRVSSQGKMMTWKMMLCRR